MPLPPVAAETRTQPTMNTHQYSNPKNILMANQKVHKACNHETKTQQTVKKEKVFALSYKQNLKFTVSIHTDIQTIFEIH